jgi:hypothetical protein
MNWELAKQQAGNNKEIAFSSGGHLHMEVKCLDFKNALKTSALCLLNLF